MVCKFSDKKSSGSGVNMHANNEIKQNQLSLDWDTHQLAEELHKPISKNLKSNSLFRVQRKYLGWWCSWHPINKQV